MARWDLRRGPRRSRDPWFLEGSIPDGRLSRHKGSEVAAWLFGDMEVTLGGTEGACAWEVEKGDGADGDRALMPG